MAIFLLSYGFDDARFLVGAKDEKTAKKLWLADRKKAGCFDKSDPFDSSELNCEPLPVVEDGEVRECHGGL